MAFPIAHPAVVLPLALLPKRYASATGLIIGSLTPDLPHLAGISASGVYDSWTALFWFCLPAGLILSFTFHRWLRVPLILWLPRGLKSRFARFKEFDWVHHLRRYWPAVILSLLVGSASHLAWDALDLTHTNGHVFRDLLAFTKPLNLGAFQIPLIRTIQHTPSVLGIIFIGLFIYRMPQ
jgi:hypothetical protein